MEQIVVVPATAGAGTVDVVADPTATAAPNSPAVTTFSVEICGTGDMYCHKVTSMKVLYVCLALLLLPSLFLYKGSVLTEIIMVAEAIVFVLVFALLKRYRAVKEGSVLMAMLFAANLLIVGIPAVSILRGWFTWSGVMASTMAFVYRERMKLVHALGAYKWPWVVALGCGILMLLMRAVVYIFMICGHPVLQSLWSTSIFLFCVTLMTCCAAKLQDSFVVNFKDGTTAGLLLATIFQLISLTGALYTL
ncbi:hypothetical protein Pelo_14558 [Pelomyxa schiedti]|nr:hypothetical protein Pelo_14545 [Pelomyxa schiedti]KAH3744058.1 hypothetical protein Pelo_14558 [Pelomyxa schiedti]